jgi:hypothetical protein
MITKQAARLAAATAAAVGVISGIAACSAPASTPHGAAGITNMGATHHMGPVGRGSGGAASCATNAVAGYIGTERAGEAAAASQALGPALLSRVSDSGLGTVDIARNAHGLSSTALGALFSKWYPVDNQSSQSDLKSCHYLLDDKPAAHPLIASAEDALAKAGLVSSAADLQSQLQVGGAVLASDNPLSPGSVIMTLSVPGPVNPTPPAPGPTVHTRISYTVIENQSTARATGVASGGF